MKKYYLYLKYQLFVKILTTLIIFPIFSLICNYLIRLSGRTNLSSGDYLEFIFSFKGFGFLLVSLLLMLILIAMDINSFIIISAMIKEKRIEANIYNMFMVAIESIKLLFKPSAFFIMIYISLFIPLLGVGFTISPMKNFQIPNFITSVIYSNKLYYSIYIFSLLIILIVSLKYIFVLHYMLLLNDKILDALKKSNSLIMNNKKNFLYKVVFKIISIFLILFLIIAILFFIINIINIKLLEIYFSLIISELFALMSIIFIPIVCVYLTEFIYTYDNIKINFKLKNEYKNKKDLISLKIFLIVVSISNILIALGISYFFNNIFKINENIEIIAHRGGGNLGPENTLYSLEKAIEKKVNYSEIDIQRTKDNKYIINHDKTFYRVSNVNKTSYNLTLDKIKKLKVLGKEPIATLEEFLDLSKNKVKLFLELKGYTADEKMVDDVIKLLREKDMLKEVVLVSLNYNLIKYIEEHYSFIDTGYIYFFAIGNVKNLYGDYLIMEEREATESKIDRIKKAGKKAIVWTVNTEDSIKKFTLSNIDGIITDDVIAVQEAIENRKKMNYLEIIMYKLLEI